MESHKTDSPHRTPGAAHTGPGAPVSETPTPAPAVERVTHSKEPPAEVKVEAPHPGDKTDKSVAARKKPTVKNNVRKMRTEKMMSKAELARRAGMSTLTIDRVERGMPCRMDTKRKILEALGLKPSDRVIVFGEDD